MILAEAEPVVAAAPAPPATNPPDGGTPLPATDYAGLDDRELASLAARDRDGAFRELLSRYERPVFALVYRMVRNREQAEDLAQETFIRAFGAIGSFDPSYRFSNWIFKIANNLTIDHLRRRKLDTVSIHGSADATTPEDEARTSISLASHDERPDEYVENRELGAQLEEAIGRLRPEYRTVTLLRHVDGYSYDEIADLLQLPLGTVKTYIHRARLELKDALQGVL